MSETKLEYLVKEKSEKMRKWGCLYEGQNGKLHRCPHYRIDMGYSFCDLVNVDLIHLKNCPRMSGG